jgi:alpha-beta hydrolase superfamily lysophospholipase
MNTKSFFTAVWLTAFVAFCGLPASAEAAPEQEKLSFTTADGVRIIGIYRAPADGQNMVVLLHGLGSTKEEWESFEKVLAEKGYGYFAYDARGHGESVKTTAGRTLDYRNFDQPGPGSQWNRMIADLESVISSLSGTKKIPQQKIGIAGASLGANVALSCAAADPKIPYVALLSPGLSYAGIETSDSLRSYLKRPLVIVASPNDTYAWRSSQLLCSIAPHAVLLTGPGGHGVQMFNGKFEKRVFKVMEMLASPDPNE